VIIILKNKIYLKFGYLFIFIIIFPILIFGEKYKVSFLGIPVVDVEITESVLPNNSIKILYHTKTNKYFYLFYKVDNYYELILDPDYKNIEFYKKKIDQKGFSQSYEVHFKNDSVYYSNGIKKMCRSPVQNILGLIIELKYYDVEEINNVLIEHEGIFYKSNIQKVPERSNKLQTTYRIYTKNVRGKKVLKETDIYSWKIVDSTAVREITYSNVEESIIEARFKFGKLTLSAKRVE